MRRILMRLFPDDGETSGDCRYASIDIDDAYARELLGRIRLFGQIMARDRAADELSFLDAHPCFLAANPEGYEEGVEADDCASVDRVASLRECRPAEVE